MLALYVQSSNLYQVIVKSIWRVVEIPRKSSISLKWWHELEGVAWAWNNDMSLKEQHELKGAPVRLKEQLDLERMAWKDLCCWVFYPCYCFLHSHQQQLIIQTFWPPCSSPHQWNIQITKHTTFKYIKKTQPSAVATPLLGMRPQSSTPTHTCIHDVHWRHGTSGVSPTLWIGSMETSPLRMTGSLHTLPLTPEVRARAISFNFPPKFWTEHLCMSSLCI